MTGTFRVIRGDCRAVLPDRRLFGPNHFHSIITDPPYGLGFMGRAWDHGVPGVDFWQLALEAARPGAILAAFSSPRTYHRLAVNIEDAGWEIRDCLVWLYGSGMPKGLDVAKAIDKRRDDRVDVLRVTAAIAEARDAAGKTNGDIDDAFGTHGMAGHWTSSKSQPHVPGLDTWERLKRFLDAPGLGALDELVATLNDRKGEFGEAWAAREITGTVEEWTDRTNYAMTSRDGLRRDVPHLPEAARWDGFNTAIKPAWEPIVIARKPPEGTIADNVLRWGCGAYNVDACRVSGRWPANVMVDDAAAVMLDEMSGDAGGNSAVSGREPSSSTAGIYNGRGRVAGAYYGDAGGASRFFYTAKADSEERHAGVEGLFWRMDDAGDPHEVTAEAFAQLAPGARRQGNPHPTVKPLDLMRWVTRLVTPPGGRVLDMFAGSGSTLAAAVPDGFDVTGIEIAPWAAKVAGMRAKHWQQGGAVVRSHALEPQRSLFDSL